MQSIRDDLAYLRALAAEGRSAPLVGGHILITAGVVFGLASLVHWAVAADVLQLPSWAYLATWVAAGLIFAAALFGLKGRIRNKPGAQAAVNKAVSAAWMGLGFACFALFVAFYAAAWRTGSWQIMNLYAPVILSLYGAAWTVAAQMTGRKWIWIFAIGSFVAAVASAFLIGDPAQYLAYAASLFLLAAVPGLITARSEPSDVV